MKFDERMSRRELARSVGIGTRLNGLSQDISFSEIISIRWLRQITIYQRYVFVLRSSKGFQCTSAFRLLSSFNLTCVKIWEMSKYCLHFATSDCWMLWAKNCHSWGVWKKKTKLAPRNAVHFSCVNEWQSSPDRHFAQYKNYHKMTIKFVNKGN